jgi:hypothetical protein
MVAAIVGLSRATIGDSLFSIRFFLAVAGSVTIAFAGILAAQANGDHIA